MFDIQDVGARFYTYVWTMYHAMVGAALRGVRFLVLDRPNPLGGNAYGPMMTSAFTSGVGLKEVVQQHGMTVGELARMFDATFVPQEAGRSVGVEVEQVRGWRRSTLYAGTGLPWVRAEPEHADAGHGAGVPGDRACSRAPTCRRGAAPPVRSSGSVRRTSTSGGRTR